MEIRTVTITAAMKQVSLGVQAEARAETEHAGIRDNTVVSYLPFPQCQRKPTLTDGTAMLSSVKSMLQKQLG